MKLTLTSVLAARKFHRGLYALLLLTQTGCAKHARIDSPDGKYALDVSYAGQGALGADYANVVLRSRSSDFELRIFHGEAQWDFNKDVLAWPQIKWIDNSHIAIGPFYGEATCEVRAENIQITCEPPPSP